MLRIWTYLPTGVLCYTNRVAPWLLRPDSSKENWKRYSPGCSPLNLVHVTRVNLVKKAKYCTNCGTKL